MARGGGGGLPFVHGGRRKDDFSCPFCFTFFYKRDFGEGHLGHWEFVGEEHMPIAPRNYAPGVTAYFPLRNL